jgi:cobalt/nickel transport system permease protein
MIKEPFAAGNSLIHQLDPRFRVVVAAAFCLAVALSKQFSVLFAAMAVSIVLIFAAQLKLKEVLRRLAVVLGFLLLIWLVLPITFEGERLYRIYSFTITRPGVILSAQITLKSTAILLSFMALMATMSIASMGHALHGLHFPGKLVYLFLMTYRYIFVFEQEYGRLWTAVKIRGFRSGTNIHSYKTFAYLIGMLFVRASARAERVHQAMLCRGFSGRFYSLMDFPFSRRNWIFAVLMALVISILITLEFTGIWKITV